ncbi:RagB/SusD family nutrient uptake outer membrane protein [Flavitalea sp. BT771]|uniref:RagB/SusD family nutrient uptake outer membrane protein n=1 Tax=Flavitalea sp. BT771 TaxID=3063329 RepID=UPI0026E33343|nr:RagB/SusD family nutrient uptake outer membrane protein [Flavitalea sp. BT771]MDO6429344.1 RagB/SusD family nutrient uptake outer membrane protein [Flavitalea sp. BT771]MDV6218528.1 RagB/SusD family nutrient uptake outer membrane protein [Flavitalea sp. BT771]
MNTLHTRTFLLLLPALLFFGCSKKLDQVPKTDLSDVNFWNTTNDMKLACNYLYSFLPPINSHTDDDMSADAFGLSANSVSDGSWLPPATADSWTGNYNLIRACNNILEKSVKVKGDQGEISKYLGETRFFRAWGYFDLVKRYGDVPFVTKTLQLTDTLLYTGRTNREIVLDSVYADLDFAVAHLPGASQQASEEYGRITSTAALAFKSRVALFEGTRMKFFGQAGYQTHLQKAIDASDAIIGQGNNGLFTYAANPDSSYYYLFQYTGEGQANPENILVRIYGENQVNDISANNYTREVLDEGLLMPTSNFTSSYLYKDGLPSDKSPYYQTQTNTYTEFENRDPRMAMTIFNKYSWYVSGLYVPTFEYSQTGYRSCKYYIAADWTINVSYIDNIIIRYAEVLLNNLEARFELNGSVTDDELNATLNLIRARAKMPALTNNFVSSNGLDMRTEIRRERRIELAFEGFRYWDLLRWKTAETELPQAIIGVKYFPAEQGQLDDPHLTSDGFIITQDANKRHFNPERDYLWPIPTQELGLNPKLTPNPKW